MTDRAHRISGFLSDAGWGDAARDPLAADASSRSYDRLIKSDGSRAILMNAPPQSNEPVSIFHGIAERLSTVSLSAPQIYAVDNDNGMMLIEDLGDDLFARLAPADPELERTIYAHAIDALCHLHKTGDCSDLPPYDDATYRREAELVTDWYLPNVTNRAINNAEYSNLVSAACAKLKDSPVLVMRDYHAENLLWLPARDGVARVGLLDFQDALAGHPAYDLVSLLEDARRDTSPTLQTEMKARYCSSMGVDIDTFKRDYAILGAQRNLKIIGIFARLCLRDKKPHYVDLIPRVWGHLQNDLAHPDLAELAVWVAENIPAPSEPVLTKLRGALIDE